MSLPKNNIITNICNSYSHRCILLSISIKIFHLYFFVAKLFNSKTADQLQDPTGSGLFQNYENSPA